MSYQPTLFEEQKPSEPLAARMRPRDLSEFCGQEHLLGEHKVLRRIIESDAVGSMIFWGPPGVGKTTLARVIAHRTKARFIDFSAVTSGIKEIKQVMEQAESARRFGEKTIVFVDEIHRFNKAQQDAFLPYVERGSIILIGATTENPSFEVNGALLSRCKVFVLQALKTEDILALLRRAGRLPKHGELKKQLAAFIGELETFRRSAASLTRYQFFRRVSKLLYRADKLEFITAQMADKERDGDIESASLRIQAARDFISPYKFGKRENTDLGGIAEAADNIAEAIAIFDKIMVRDDELKARRTKKNAD